MLQGNVKMTNKMEKIIESAVSKLTENRGKHSYNINLIVEKEKILEILEDLLYLAFAGYFTENPYGQDFARDFIGEIYKKLYEQIRKALVFKEGGDNASLEDKVDEITLKFIDNIPRQVDLLQDDVKAHFEGDPAASGYEEIILSYPGLYAVAVHRFAHVLYELDVPFIPRIMSEYAHTKTGIDINPGARIGRGLFIDHGTGVVIGETAEIGNNVQIYQGVTLGALSPRHGQSLSGKKRHPTVEDNVTIYANATVLGGGTTIGKGSVISGNTTILSSVKQGVRVSAKIDEPDICEICNNLYCEKK